MTELYGRAARSPLAAYFPQTEDTLISSCLQGHMGRAAAGDGCAALLTGDFAFAAGAPAREALIWLDENKKGLLILSGAEEWRDLAAQYADRAPARAVRYALSAPAQWDEGRLARLAACLPPDVALRPMDEKLFAQCRAQEELRDLGSAFATMADFAAHGAGVLAVRAGRVLAGASTYAWDDRGIEVEIDTLPAFRRQGLATACGAALLLCCLQKGLRAHWDAANQTSLRLAQRLGYHSPRAYEVIVWQ